MSVAGWTLTSIALCCLPFAAAAPPPFQADDRALRDRIDALIAQMTIEEKLGQLTQQAGGAWSDDNPGVRETKLAELADLVRDGKVGSFLGAHGAAYINGLQRVAVEESRHRIPLIFGNDVIHGYRTIFPIPLGEAASWDLEMVEHTARVAAVEATAAGTHWTFAPMVDICRDARWGRIAEGAGEDPFLGSAIAAARVRGFQGPDLRAPDSLLACAKHYVAYGAAEAGRDYNTVDLSLTTLHDVYLPPFHAAVEAGVGSIMSAFNEINGVPASGNHYTLQTVLREQWGFEGFVVSDWSSVTEMVAHGHAANDAEAARLGILAGVDMDMSSSSYRTHLGDFVRDGRLSGEVVDQALRRVLTMKHRVGLFEEPYADPARESRELINPAHRAIAREMARRSLVLLKNDGATLPISPAVKSLAVIGALADSGRDQLGTWAGAGRAEEAVTLLAGIRERAGGAVQVRFAKGCEALGDKRDGFEEALAAARESDFVLLVLGESENLSGEANSRADIGLPGVQLDLAKAVLAVGKPSALVLMTGRPLAIPWCAENLPAILVAWHPGTEGGHAIADVLFGDVNPCGRLPVTFPRHVGQLPLYHNHKNTGRPPRAEEHFTSKYNDVPWTPQFPFGYGLSYTKFSYANLAVSASTIRPAGSLTVTVEVTNSGQREGAEVVQLYIRDVVGTLTRPVRELKGFARVTLKPGETRTVSFVIGPAHLAYHDGRDRRAVEPGAFEVWAGPSAAEGLKGSFEVVP